MALPQTAFLALGGPVAVPFAGRAWFPALDDAGDLIEVLFFSLWLQPLRTPLTIRCALLERPTLLSHQESGAACLPYFFGPDNLQIRSLHPATAEGL